MPKTFLVKRHKKADLEKSNGRSHDENILLFLMKITSLPDAKNDKRIQR